MELILGGAFQGKLQFAQEHYGFLQKDIANGSLDNTKKVIYNLQDYIYNSVKSGKNTLEDIERFVKENPNMVFICNEVGGGLVPIDPLERHYRECVGRACCIISKNSQKVYRIVCGIPMEIKNA